MLNENVIKFIKICEELDIKDKINDLENNFEQRLLVQKIFYFLQKLGFSPKIKYNFYKYGPYSPDLTDIYYRSLELSKKDLKPYTDIQFTGNEKKILEKIKEILNKWGADLKKLEYYSSVLFVYEDMYFKDWNQERIKSKISILKPKHYDQFGFSNVIKELKDLGLIKNSN